MKFKANRNSNHNYTFTLTSAFIVMMILVCITGWVMNIMKLIGMDMEPLTTLLILRIIGVFFGPLGVFLGYFF